MVTYEITHYRVVHKTKKTSIMIYLLLEILQYPVTIGRRVSIKACVLSCQHFCENLVILFIKFAFAVILQSEPDATAGQNVQ